MTLALDLDSLVLDASEESEMDLLAKRLTAVAPGRVDDPEWLAAARDHSCHIPARLAEQIRRFRADPGPHGVLHVRGLPVRPDVPTPNEPGSDLSGISKASRLRSPSRWLPGRTTATTPAGHSRSSHSRRG